ncbi:MAG: hypothetical protein QOG80_692 [Pseudonocardiales bacterium]|nr:hypothetical protein [Pseudonocardiales bacterium]
MAAALDFAIYFMKAVDWSIATNDASLLRGITSRRCEPCASTIAVLEALSVAHQTLTGGRIRIESAGFPPGHFTVKSEYVVQIKTTQQREVIRDSQGKPVHDYAAAEDTSLVFLKWVTNRWQVVDLGGPS